MLAMLMLAVMVTVYQPHDGCGMTEYWEHQVPEENVKCTSQGCQALINGAWRIVVKEKPHA